MPTKSAKLHKIPRKFELSSSKSSKVIDIGSNRKHICDFLLVINSNFGLISYRFRVWNSLIANRTKTIWPSRTV